MKKEKVTLKDDFFVKMFDLKDKMLFISVYKI